MRFDIACMTEKRKKPLPPVRLRNMTAPEFARFRVRSVADYAKDLMRSGGPSEAQCRMQAQREWDELLPEGAATENHFLLAVEDRKRGEAVGQIWFLYEITDGVRQAFLSDLQIDAPERRKGYASSALSEMERRAETDGCLESVIYVWRHNFPGVRLYRKNGYLVFRESEDGLYLKKQLQPQK